MVIIEILKGSAFCAGMAMGVASIMSVGPNNLTLIREGLSRGRIGLVASIIWVSYVLILIIALALGDKIAVQGASVRPYLSWLGFLALCWFAFLSLKSYVLASNTFQDKQISQESVMHCIQRTLVIVWCNPLTYVELLIIPAAISCSFMMPVCRVLFIAGLMIMATVACYGYSYGSGLLAARLRQANTLRMFDLGSGVLLSIMATLMAIGLLVRPA